MSENPSILARPSAVALLVTSDIYLEDNVTLSTGIDHTINIFDLQVIF